jgi:hypothetical protein
MWQGEHYLFYERFCCCRTSTLSFLATDFSRGNVVSVAPRYRLDGSGFESPWGPRPSRPDPKPTHLTGKMPTDLYPGGKADGAWR